MRKRDCALLTYRLTGVWLCHCHLANDFKNQLTAYFSLRGLTTRANEPQDLTGYWTKVYQICSRSIFFIDGVDATIRVAIRLPVVEWEGWHLKKKVTSVKHKPAGGISMPAGRAKHVMATEFEGLVKITHRVNLSREYQTREIIWSKFYCHNHSRRRRRLLVTR